MRDQEIIGLWEAYQQVHAQPQEEVEQLDEGYQRNPENDPDYVPPGERPTREQRMRDPKTGINSPAFAAFMAKQMGGKKKKKVDEETDLFDYLLEYLVAEGYADTNKAALAIMANMSEEWKQSIVEGVRPGDVETPLDKAAFKKRRRSLAGREANADARSRGHVDKFTGKPYGTEEAASRRKDIHSPEKEPERKARRKAEEDPD